MSSGLSSANTASTSTFVTALVFNAAVFGIELAIFTAVRPFFPAIYQPRTYVPPKTRRAPLVLRLHFVLSIQSPVHPHPLASAPRRGIAVPSLQRIPLPILDLWRCISTLGPSTKRSYPSPRFVRVISPLLIHAKHSRCICAMSTMRFLASLSSPGRDFLVDRRAVPTRRGGTYQHLALADLVLMCIAGYLSILHDVWSSVSVLFGHAMSFSAGGCGPTSVRTLPGMRDCGVRRGDWQPRMMQ